MAGKSTKVGTHWLGDKAPVAAVACLLMPTLLTLSLPSEAECSQLIRAVVGVVAFVVLMLRGDLAAKGNQIVKTVQDSAKHDSNAELAKFTEQVVALLPQLHPTATCLQTTADLEELVDDRVSAILPGSSVKAYVSGPFWRSTPYAASVPEIEVAVNTPLPQLEDLLQGGRQKALELDKNQIVKRSLRVLLKRLLAADDFSFRRSSFTSPEAKVTLVAGHLGDPSQVVAFNFHLNSSTPEHNQLLKAECAKLFKPFEDLNVLVRRWAKVRGLCNSSMGYFPPYIWTLLLIYYLQRCDKPCLPRLRCTVDSAGEPWVSASRQLVDACPASHSNVGALVAKHFAGFLQFYKSVFNWETEQVCITEDGATLSSTDRLTIYDPFHSEYLSCSKLSPASLSRLSQELGRANDLVNKEAQLSDLLEQWIPHANQQSSDSGDGDATQ